MTTTTTDDCDGRDDHEADSDTDTDNLGFGLPGGAPGGPTSILLFSIRPSEPPPGARPAMLSCKTVKSPQFGPSPPTCLFLSERRLARFHSGPFFTPPHRHQETPISVRSLEQEGAGCD